MLASNKRSPEAIALFREALSIQEASLGRDHPSVSTTLNNLGFAQLEAGDPIGAAASFERGLAIVEAKLGADHHRAAFHLVGLGQAYLAQKQARSAVAPLRRGLAILEHAHAVAGELGEARFTLARALWDANVDRKGAVALANQALADFTTADDSEMRATIDGWLSFRDLQRRARRGTTAP